MKELKNTKKINNIIIFILLVIIFFIIFHFSKSINVNNDTDSIKNINDSLWIKIDSINNNIDNIQSKYEKDYNNIINQPLDSDILLFRRYLSEEVK